MAFSLEAKFGIDSTGVKSELKELKRSFGEFSSQLMELAGVAGVVATFAELSKGAVEMAKHITDTSLNLGIAAKAYQVLQFSAEEAGVSQESFDKSLEKVRSKVIEAAEGNKEAAGALAKLGLNAQALIRLPLEQQYTKIAQAVSHSSNQTEAYSAIVSLFGEKVAPKLMEALQSLGKEGFAKAAEEAEKAGVVMEDSTIAALNRASLAIDKFKKEATVAVGNILVNFRTADGIELMGLQLIKAAASFGGKVLDALGDADSFVKATLWGTFLGLAHDFNVAFISGLEESVAWINDKLPKAMQFDLSGFNKYLDGLKANGEGVADSIARAIAGTHPSTFQKDADAFWGKIVSDQQGVVDKLNKVDFHEAVDKLDNAGKKLKPSMADAVTPIVDASKKLEDSARKAAETFAGAVKNLAQATGQMMDQAATNLQLIGGINGKTLAGMSNDSLQSLIRQDKRKGIGLQEDTAFAFHDSAEINQLKNEIANAQKELDVRNKFQSDISGPGGANDASVRDRYDPQIFDKLLQQFGPGAQDTNTKIANGIDQLNAQLKKGIPTVFFGGTTSS